MEFTIEFSPDYAGAISRLGIDPIRSVAPDGQRVIAIEANSVAKALDESVESAADNANRRSLGDPDSRDAAHRLLNQLNTTKLALVLARELDSRGDHAGAEEMLRQAVSNYSNGTLGLFPPDEEEAAPAVGNKLSVLIIEDEPTEARLLLECLELHGLTAEIAGDGIDAMKRLRQGPPPAAILVDMLMPRMDGVAAVRAIRSNPSLAGIPVFAISGASRPEVPLTDGPGGIDAWFPKPFEVSDLVRSLKRLAPVG